jgi:hypothetical protein
MNKQNLQYLNIRQTPMENDLKISKVEYLSNNLLDHTQILNLSLDDQTIFHKALKWRKPPVQILKIKTTSNGRQPPNLI